jgi:hypothetical protein
MRRVWVGCWKLVVLAVLLGSGCAGIISEKVSEDGKLERVRLDSGTKWSSWTRNPMKQDDSCIMLKKESTF